MQCNVEFVYQQSIYSRIEENHGKTLVELTNSSLTAVLITSRQGPRRKRRSSVEMQLLLSCGMTYSIVACAAIDTVRAETASPLLLLTDHYLATAVA
jgi:hypothetical protein